MAKFGFMHPKVGGGAPRAPRPKLTGGFGEPKVQKNPYRQAKIFERRAVGLKPGSAKPY